MQIQDLKNWSVQFVKNNKKQHSFYISQTTVSGQMSTAVQWRLVAFTSGSLTKDVRYQKVSSLNK
jgi:hypothetical protein